MSWWHFGMSESHQQNDKEHQAGTCWITIAHKLFAFRFCWTFRKCCWCFVPSWFICAPLFGAILIKFRRQVAINMWSDSIFGVYQVSATCLPNRIRLDSWLAWPIWIVLLIQVCSFFLGNVLRVSNKGGHGDKSVDQIARNLGFIDIRMGFVLVWGVFVFSSLLFL